MPAITFPAERAPHHDTKEETAVPPHVTACRPSLTTTVPKEFVHRAAVAEVMLTGWQRRDEHHFSVTAQWPRAHSFFTPSPDGLHDPLIAAETIRQVGSLLAHAEYGVPLGHHFLMRHLEVAVDPGHLAVGPAPAALDLAVTATETTLRAGHLAHLRYEVTLRREGHTAATGSASFNTATPAVYRRLRGRDDLTAIHPLPLTAPAPPHTVARTSPTDVVLTPTPTPHHWQLRADTRHPVLFDHPVDHVPGMVLLEAARQAAAAAKRSATPPTRLHATFTHYVELDTPCHIHATPHHHTPHPHTPHPHTPDGHTETIHVTGHQNTTEAFTCHITTTPPTPH
ncbi:ScbA/BarX family gamma-butyrolactone biosynthesis protein [Streptomyces sp. NPDC101225]|uniref:ScbA/BarX family gamma-butyrolactone biosynthesis protein n=1 Tax=Streptomyces sp. NPDC101225 TaxID=3366135 RepID=UPI0038293016